MGEKTAKSELLWAGTLFDALGHSLVRKAASGGKTLFYLRLELHYGKSTVLDRFVAALGGLGSVNKVTYERSSGRRYWRWTVTGKNAVKAVNMLRPFLRPEGERYERLVKVMRKIALGKKIGRIPSLEEKIEAQMQEPNPEES